MLILYLFSIIFFFYISLRYRHYVFFTTYSTSLNCDIIQKNISDPIIIFISNIILAIFTAGSSVLGLYIAYIYTKYEINIITNITKIKQLIIKYNKVLNVNDNLYKTKKELIEEFDNYFNTIINKNIIFSNKYIIVHAVKRIKKVYLNKIKNKIKKIEKENNKTEYYNKHFNNEL